MAADDEKTNVLAALVSKSQDEDVKNVLRLYDISLKKEVGLSRQG